MFAIFTQTRNGLQWHEAFNTLEEAQQCLDAGDYDKPHVDFAFIIRVEAFRDVDGFCVREVDGQALFDVVNAGD